MAFVRSKSVWLCTCLPHWMELQCFQNVETWQIHCVSIHRRTPVSSLW